VYEDRVLEMEHAPLIPEVQVRIQNYDIPHEPAQRAKESSCTPCKLCAWFCYVFVITVTFLSHSIIAGNLVIIGVLLTVFFYFWHVRATI